MHRNPNNGDDPQKYELRVHLTIQKGRAKNLVRTVHGPVFTLGTDPSCDMVLGDPQFPDVHSYVCVRDSTVSLRHLGQGPPVTVNGREVRWGELRDGDRIRTGPYEFRIRIVRQKATRPSSSNPSDNIAFAGTLDQLPSWWSAVTDMHVDWQSLAGNMSLRDRRFGSRSN
jgi:predicted component of type VI protein secretion system